MQIDPDLDETQELKPATQSKSAFNFNENSGLRDDAEEHHFENPTSARATLGKLYGTSSISKFGNNTDARDEQIERIEAMFGEFGPSVSVYMLAQLLSQGGITRTVQRLGLRTRGREGADMVQIENWILTNGVENFCRLVGIQKKNQSNETPPPQDSSPEQSKEAHPESPELKVRPINPSEGSSSSPRQRFSTGGINRHKISREPGRSHQDKVTFKPIKLGEEKALPEETPEKKEPVEPPTSPRQAQGFKFAPQTGRNRPPGQGGPEGGKA